MNIKHLLTVSLAVLLSACNNSNNDVPIQSNGDGYDSQYYQNPPITTTDALAVGAVGVATGYAVGKYTNKPKANYSKPNNGYGKPVVRASRRYKRK